MISEASPPVLPSSQARVRDAQARSIIAQGYKRVAVTLSGEMIVSSCAAGSVLVVPSLTQPVFGSGKLAARVEISVSENQVALQCLHSNPDHLVSVSFYAQDEASGYAYSTEVWAALDNNVLVQRHGTEYLLLLIDTRSTLKHRQCLKTVTEIRGMRTGQHEEDDKKAYETYGKQVSAKFHGLRFSGEGAETRCKRAAGELISLVLAARGLPVAENSEQRWALLGSWSGWGALPGPGTERAIYTEVVAGRLELDPRATMPRRDAGGQPCAQRSCAFRACFGRVS